MDADHVEDVLERVPGAALAVGSDGRLLGGTESTSVVFGAPVEELVGEHLSDLVEAGYLEPGVVERFDALSGSEDRFQVRVVGSETGTATPYDVAVTRAGDAFDGTIWSLTAVGTDERYAQTVEALHRATRDLVGADSRAEVYQRAGRAANEVLGFPGVGVREHDPESGTLAFVTFGSRIEEIDSRPAYDVDDSPHGRAFRTGETVVESIPDEGDPYDREVFSHTMYVPIEGYGVLSVGTVGGPFEDADRRFAEILAKNTEAALRQVEQRERLRRNRRHLQRQNERLEEFASVVSHDLRNPLGLAQGAFRTYRDTDDPEQAETVAFALDRMERIVDDVLTMARTGDVVESPGVVDLGAVAREAWDTVDTGSLTLSTPDDARVVADRDRLLRVFENAFRNVVDHATGEAAAGDPATAVRVESIDDGFAVVDDGPGLPADVAVFEAGCTTAAEGTGFGLSIVERIAEAHGWTVHATTCGRGGLRLVFGGVDYR